jgi:Xaa-Pro aminopeptidase
VSPHEELAAKAERLRRLAAARGLDGILLGTQHNFAWLTGGRENGLDRGSDEGSCRLLVARSGAQHVLADAIEMPRVLAEDVAGLPFTPAQYAWEEQAADPALALRLAQRLCGPRIGVDWPGTEAPDVEGDVMRARTPLLPVERARLRALGRDAGEFAGAFCRALRPGGSEDEVARGLRAGLAERGMRAVVTLVAADERIARFRHPLPTAAAWRSAVMVVACVRRHGLVVSLTRIVHAGSVPADLEARTRAAAQVSARIHAATRVGVTGAGIYAAAASAYEAAGHPGEERRHHQGGACGYRIRDWIAHPACAERVQEGQAFAWNPSVTGTKVEDTCLLEGEELEWITASPGWPSLETHVGGRDYPAPAVLSVPA